MQISSKSRIGPWFDSRSIAFACSNNDKCFDGMHLLQTGSSASCFVMENSYDLLCHFVVFFRPFFSHPSVHLVDVLLLSVTSWDKLYECQLKSEWFLPFGFLWLDELKDVLLSDIFRSGSWWLDFMLQYCLW